MTEGGGHTLRDGRVVMVEPAGPDQVAAITELYRQLSPESFRRRFLGGHPCAAVVARLARIDSAAGMASLTARVADEPGLLAGEARYVRMEPGVAELALTVLDRYQGTGLGRVLLDALVERARRDGLQRLRAVVSVSNVPMLRLLSHYGLVLGDAEEADPPLVACVDISVTGGMPGWSAAAGPRVLIERSGWFEDGRAAALRAAGNEVLQCPGPQRLPGRVCPLLTTGHCGLAETASRIVCLLPADDQDGQAIIAAHMRRWPDRVVT